MSSKEFMTTFENAAGLVTLRLAAESGVEATLDNFRTRVASDVYDPLENRSLVIDPDLDAQMIGVPAQTVEKVVKELRRLDLVHLWARATCSSNEHGDDETIIETNRAEEFGEALATSCPHCGQIHDDIEWEQISTFYAFNFTLKKDRFKFSDYFRETPEIDCGNNERKSRWLKFIRLKKGILSFFEQRDDSPAKSTVNALAMNRPASVLPSPLDLLRTLWGYALTLILIGSVTAAIAGLLIGSYAAIIVAAVFILFFSGLVYLTLRSISSASALERRISVAGNLVTLAVLAQGSGFSGSATVGEDKPWHVTLLAGEPDGSMIFAAVIVFSVTQIAIAFIQHQKLKPLTR